MNAIEKERIANAEYESEVVERLYNPDYAVEKSGVEFNTGFLTSLLLFYGHRNQYPPGRRSDSLRLYGSSDHFFGLDIPEELPEDLKKEVEALQDYALSKRLVGDTFQNAQKAYEKAKEISLKVAELYNSKTLMLIYLDEKHTNGPMIDGDGEVQDNYIILAMSLDLAFFGLKPIVNYG